MFLKCFSHLTWDSNCCFNFYDSWHLMIAHSPSRCPACPPCTSSSGWASRGIIFGNQKTTAHGVSSITPPNEKNHPSILKICEPTKKRLGWLSQNHFCPAILKGAKKKKLPMSASSTPGGAVHHQKVPWLFQELLLDPSRAAKSEPLLGHGASWGHGAEEECSCFLQKGNGQKWKYRENPGNTGNHVRMIRESWMRLLRPEV